MTHTRGVHLLFPGLTDPYLLNARLLTPYLLNATGFAKRDRNCGRVWQNRSRSGVRGRVQG